MNQSWRQYDVEPKITATLCMQSNRRSTFLVAFVGEECQLKYETSFEFDSHRSFGDLFDLICFLMVYQSSRRISTLRLALDHIEYSGFRNCLEASRHFQLKMVSLASYKCSCAISSVLILLDPK